MASNFFTGILLLGLMSPTESDPTVFVAGDEFRLPLSDADEPIPPAERPEPDPAPSAEWAFVSDGFYYGFALDLGVAPNFATDADFEVNSDWVDSIGLEAGFRFGALRFGTEMGFQTVRIHNLVLGPASPFPVDDYGGNLTSLNLMGAVYVESPIALFGLIRPYAGWGGGISVVHARYTPEDCFFGVCSLSDNDVVSDTDSARSWQFAAGLTIASDAPGTEFFVGYRHFETEDLRFRTEAKTHFIQDGIDSHTLFIGIRIGG